MTWVLVIFVARFGGLYQSSPATAITTIPGYQSEAKCKAAAEAIEKWPVKPSVWCVPGPQS
jgi:hypothetical protein